MNPTNRTDYLKFCSYFSVKLRYIRFINIMLKEHMLLYNVNKQVIVIIECYYL